MLKHAAIFGPHFKPLFFDHPFLTILGCYMSQILLGPQNSRDLKSFVIQRKAEGDSNGQIKRQLVELGVDIRKAHSMVCGVQDCRVQKEAYPFSDTNIGSYDQSSKSNVMIFGLLWTVFGLLLAIITYSSAPKTIMFVISYGTIILGFFQFLRGFAMSNTRRR